MRSAPLSIWHVNVGNHAGMVDGVAVVATQLARAEAAAGHTVRLVASAYDFEPPWPQSGHRRSKSSDSGVDGVAWTPVTSVREALRITARLLDDPASRPDVVHLHSVFRPAHRLLAGRLRRRGIPVVLSPHSGLAPALLQRDRLRKAVYGQLVERRLHRVADGVHALQLVEHDDVRRYCGTDRAVAVIPNPVEPALLTTEPWQPVVHTGDDNRPRAVLLCRYDVYQKGLDRLDALARLLPQVDFHVYGHTDANAPARAEALIRSAPANLHFEAPVYDDEKLKVLREADVFLQPSRVEGLSMALAEALALGVPCAVSSYVGRSLAMDRNGTALVLPDDAASAADQLAALLADSSHRLTLSQAARAYAAHELHPDVVTSNHLAHYRALVG